MEDFKIGQKVYDLSNIHYFTNKYHYDKGTLDYISNRKIIEIDEENQKFAISKFNGRIENWFPMNQDKCTGNNWDTNIYTINKKVVYKTYKENLDLFKTEQEQKDQKEIEELLAKIESIKNKTTLSHKWIENREKALEDIKRALNIKIKDNNDNDLNFKDLD